MEKTRVPKGEKYWFIIIENNGQIGVRLQIELYQDEDDTHWWSGNYFNTQGEAESTARKLLAVLHGAGVYTQEEITEIKINDFSDRIEAELRKSKIVK